MHRFCLTAFLLVLAATNLQASDGVLQSITVTPPNSSIAKGSTLQFTATGNYSDFTTLNLTPQATWNSSSPSVATVSSSGLVTALSMGTTIISASVDGILGSTNLTVTGGFLQSITVTPANPSLGTGSTLQFTATGNYSDLTSVNLTSQVTWTSSTPSIATISSNGLATANSAGTTTIRASMGGILGSTNLTVTGGFLQSITVTPANPSLGTGSTLQFTATGNYSDLTSVNLTNQVTWTSSTPSIATISSKGLATAISAGTTTIRASMGGILGSTNLTVTGGVLQSITATPTNASVGKGSTLQFTATGNYSDFTSVNLTSRVTWSSSLPSVAMISSSGLATAISDGTTIIRASMGGILGSTALTTVSSRPTVISFRVLFGSSSFDVIGSSRNRLPWQISGITVVFSDAIATGSAASLGGITATGFSGLGTNTLTWTFDPISIGSFATTLAGSGPDALMDGAGNALAGGAGFTRVLRILTADVNDDGVVNADDLALVNAARSQPFNIFDDLDGNGVVNTSDVQIARTRNATTLP